MKFTKNNGNDIMWATFFIKKTNKKLVCQHIEKQKYSRCITSYNLIVLVDYCLGWKISYYGVRLHDLTRAFKLIRQQFIIVVVAIDS